MEIKINKDLQKMQDSFVVGLSFRQTVCSGIGIALGVVTYLASTSHGINQELASWLCIAVVAPFAALGFVNYHGMPFEQLVRAWIKQYLLCPQKLLFHLENDFYERDKVQITMAQEKEAKKDA